MLAYWVHTLDPFIIRFPITWGISGIRWYGFAYFLGFVLAYFFLKGLGYYHRIKLTAEQQQGYLYALFWGILLGGRLGYVFFYQFSYYCQNPLEIFAVWQGGMSSHGGFIGVLISLWRWGQRNHFSLFSLLDLTIPLGALGIFLGRCANFINGEVFGTITNVPWGVLFPGDCFARHPSQLYEAFLEGLLPFIWSFYFVLFKKNACKTSGKLASCFLIYYSVIRCFLECFREPDAPLIMGLSRGQFYSFFTLIIGICSYYYVKKYSDNSRSIFNV